VMAPDELGERVLVTRAEPVDEILLGDVRRHVLDRTGAVPRLR
jgi:hypothetical protein